jgi:hypothetical protein
VVSSIAAELSRANIQFRVVSENEFATLLNSPQTAKLLLEALSDLTEEELTVVRDLRERRKIDVVQTKDRRSWSLRIFKGIEKPSLKIESPPTVRAVIRDQPNRTIVHLLNLNIQRLSSFEDKVTPASDIKLAVRVPFMSVRAATSYTADEHTARGPIKFTSTADADESIVELSFSKLEISAIVVIDH